MRDSIVLIAACAATACAAPRSHASAPVESPAPFVAPPRTGHADVDLTGTWATGSEGEPVARKIELHPQCNFSPAVWIIEQSGDTVRSWKMPATLAQGVASRVVVSRTPAEGWISGIDLVMGTPDARYLLHYDSTSGHLRGTLNGAPFWAVRLEIVRPQGCIPVP
jgi:hypothetical protein